MTPFFQNILRRYGIKGLFEFSRRHAILGYIWDELQDELKSFNIIRDEESNKILRRWYTLVCKIEEKNRLINEQCDVVKRKFQDEGFLPQILKGASLASLYDNPLHRSTGDIDVWLRTNDDISTEQRSLTYSRDEVVKYVRNIMPQSKICYHHMEFPAIDKTEIEVHFTPSWLANPYHNKHLQQFFFKNPSISYANSQTSQNFLFNEVFILVHVFRHLFGEGISLKQVLDYYQVLRASQLKYCLSNFLDVLEQIGLTKFFTAILWVEKEVFELDDKYVVLTPNEKEGRFLLDEIILKGNAFEDSSIDAQQLKMSDFTNPSHAHNFFSRVKRANTLICHYPDEALYEIPWRIWHFFWRRMKRY